MADRPEDAGEEIQNFGASRDVAPALPGDTASTPLISAGESDTTIPVLAETLAVSKRRRSTGRVRATTRTDVVEATAKVDLDRYRVEVERVSVGRVVDEAPAARAEDDTTIIPVVEERLVVVKQLFFVEEIHIRHVLERRAVREPVTLRRQRAFVDRLDPDGEAVEPDADLQR